MTRGIAPPSTLSENDRQTLGEVRRNIWIQSFYGLGLGATSGYLMHRAASFAVNRKWLRMNLNRNTTLASVMIGGCMGSFLFAVTQGKNTVHNLHPIFARGAVYPDSSELGDDNYRRSLQRAKERGDDLRELANSRLARDASGTQHIFDDELAAENSRLERERNRILRRASLTKTLHSGHGLNDSHGGHWVQDDGKMN